MSAEGLRVAQKDGILVLTLASPPSNMLSPGLRTALLTALARRSEDCQGIVLAADGAGFSSGRASEDDAMHPSLGDLCQAVADSPVPVVAVLHGLTTGPGAELALAARARLAASSLRIAFNDVSLGLCPAGGSTQRLPRLIGAKGALSLLLTGRMVAAPDALSLGLLDGVAEGTPLGAAVRLAGALAVGAMLTRPEPDPAAWASAVATARREPLARLPAGQRIVDCVEAALLLPVENGLAFEAVARSDLEATPEAAALRSVFRAERRATALPPVLAGLTPPSIDRIGLSGSSPGLVRIAVAALSGGMPVTWIFPDAAARADGLAAVDAGFGEAQRDGRLSASQSVQMKSRLIATETASELAMVPFVVHHEAPEAGERLGGLTGAAHLILGGADGEMGLALTPMGRVCELALHSEENPLVQATAMAGLRRIGLSPLVVGHRPVLGDRLADAGKTALSWMIARGVPRRLVAAAMDGFGVRFPPQTSAEAPTVLRAMPADEVLNRWLAALANEGARLLDEKIALRPSDIDHLMVAGYHFPRWRGGPMYQATQRGLMVLRRDLRVWAVDGPLWTPAPLIDRLIRDGRTFASLDS